MSNILLAARAQASVPATESAARASRPRLVERVRSSAVALWVGVPLAIMVLCWRALPLQPRSGLGYSWEAGMHMAVHEGITFGDHLIFTYGPLGFLSVPTLWYGDTGTIAVLYTVLLRFALALALLFAARRSFGALGGAAVAAIVVLASEVSLETVPFLVFCVWIVDRDWPTRQRLGLIAASGAVAGIELLNKESIGIEMVVLAVIVALFAQGRRRDHLLVTVSAVILALLIGWIASGQSLGLLPAYARNAAQVIAGYPAAMSLAEPGLAWQFGAGSLAVAFGVAAAWQMTADGPARRRWGIMALWLAFCVFEYKEGFVRHDAPHGTIFFVALMGGFLALRWQARRELVGVGLTAVLFVFAVAAQRASFVDVVDPVANAVSAGRQFVQVSSASQRASIMAKGRRQIEREYPIEPSTLDLLRGHTVHVEPFQTPVVWAYHLAWRPLPVFQSYGAYTSSLDRQDAETLSSSRAPQRILRDRDPEIDGRVASFVQGLSTRTMLCRYRELSTTTAWQVLGLGPNRCMGAPVSLGSVRAAWNQKVPVPAPPNERSFVYASIDGVQVGGAERVLALLYKPAARMIVLGEGAPRRLIEGTASDGLVLRAPAAVDFTRPFKVAPDAATISVTTGGRGRGDGKPITYSFFAQPVSVGPRG